MILSKVLSHRFSRKPPAARAIYEAIVAAARQTGHYENLGVPDTVDGRFDMIVLHLFLVLDRLKAGSSPLSQGLADEFFRDMDRSLREMGVGDLSVGKKVRKMAEAYQGRITAYRKAFAGDDAAVSNALIRNIYVGTDSGHAAALAQYCRGIQARLAGQTDAALEKGKIAL